MKLFFMRHAHSLSQVDRTIVVGRDPEKPLSDTGREQAAIAANTVRLLGIKRIYSSTCVRAIQTAEAVFSTLGIRVEPDELLNERSHGDLEGQKKDVVYTPELIKEIHADQLRWRPPNGETLEEVQNRLLNFLRTLENSEEESPTLIITHLMVLWALFHACTQCHHSILPKLHVDNTGLVEVDMDSADKLHLVRWNQARIKRM